MDTRLKYLSIPLMILMLGGLSGCDNDNDNDVIDKQIQDTGNSSEKDGEKTKNY